MHKSLSFVKGLIEESMLADSSLRKQQMFGGDHNKESECNEHLQELKEHFIRRVFNVTLCKYLTPSVPNTTFLFTC